MAGFMRPFEPYTYAALRIVAGFLMLCHGSQKLLGFPPSDHGAMPPLIQYGAGSIELIGGLLVMIGLQTRWAAFLVSGTMAAAYWMAHGRNAPLPIQNGGELAAIYCFVFLFLSSRGAGIWAADKSH